MLAKVISLTMFFLFSTSALGWGKTGHRIVAHLASKHLDVSTLKSVKSILGYETIEEASLWPDRIKSEARYRELYSHKHYVSFPKEDKLDNKKLLRKDHILSSLEKFERTLKDKKAKREDKQIALRFIIHLVGDLHQPLHVGYVKDMGGNSISLKWFGEATNLHRVWDENLIDMEELSYTEYVRKLSHQSPDKLKSYQSGNYLSWAKESRDYLPKTYNYSQGKFWEYEYSYKHLGYLEKRLAQAGMRLAYILNRSLK